MRLGNFFHQFIFTQFQTNKLNISNFFLFSNSLLVLQLIWFITRIASVDIKCNYKRLIFDLNGESYTCEIQNDLNFSSIQSANISNVLGIHLIDFTTNDVKSIYGNDKILGYFPRNLNKIFPNIQSIHFKSNRIKEIHNMDFKGLQNLSYLSLDDNLIIELEKGLFDDNPHMILLSFENNFIYFIDPNIFDKLTKLRHLYLNNNPCIDMDAVDNKSKINEIINRIQSKQCNKKIYKYLSDQSKEGIKDISTIKSEIQNIKSTITRIESQNSDKIRKAESQLKESQNMKILEISQKMTNLEREIKSSQNQARTKVKAEMESRLTSVYNTLNISLIRLKKSLDSFVDDSSNKTESMQKELINSLKNIANAQNFSQLIIVKHLKFLENSINCSKEELFKRTKTSVDNEKIMTNLLAKLQLQIENNEVKLRNFQYELMEEIKVMKIRIDRNLTINDNWMAALIISCTFLTTFIILIAYKKILLSAIF